MGVAGVAWATFLCQGVSCVLAVTVVLRRLRKLPAGKGSTRFSWPLFVRIARVAIPTIFQQCFISVGNVLVQGVINSFGTAVMAGYSAAIKLNNLVISCLVTVGNGISNYTAQNLGAGKLGRIRTGMGQGLRMVWLLCVPVFLAYFFVGDALMAVFLDDVASQAIMEGVTFLKIVSPFYFLIAVKLVFDGILRGSGMM
jgi:Na+-driven multidrug efflux pump